MKLTDLEQRVAYLNKITNSPLTYCETKLSKDTPFKANVGHYHIARAYGGNKLVRTDNEGGGERDITYGYVSKKELMNLINMYIAGINEVQS